MTDTENRDNKPKCWGLKVGQIQFDKASRMADPNPL